MRPVYELFADATVSPAAGACRRCGRPGAAASRPGAFLYLHRLIAVLLRAVLCTRAVRPVRRRRATFRWPGAGPTRAAVRAGQCAPNTTTSPTRLSSPPPCAGRRSGRPGAAALRQWAIFTSTGSAPCSCGLSSIPGPCALIAGGAPTSAGPAPCPRGPLSGRGSAPQIRTLRRRDCCFRRRAPAAGAVGPAPPLRARGRSCTSIGSAPCACGRSSVQGPPAPIAGGVPSSADPAPGPRGPPSGRGSAAPLRTLCRPTVTTAAVRRPPERPARRRRFAHGGVVVPPPAHRRAPAGCPPFQGCAP